MDRQGMRPGEVNVFPDELHRGAAAYTASADTLSAHAQTLADLRTSLQAAFAGAAAPLWPGIDAQLTQLTGQTAQSREGAAHGGTTVRDMADGSTEVDHVNSQSITW